ncbi:hypothetical protein [Tissierella sp. Yu-01]|uniref:hypothetical protein n=1 Tax=Tissierella sp. Yu-01 TaxID=3035694 RepID=UPI00240E943A|nr:hypothetical protein [Tissierella sp. Yu-01]WFA09343.1 hypothetical protein P3962_01850 [Tissierella sp. Yu-01]
MLRVQRYVNEINRIIDKTDRYGKEINIIGKYLRQNINNNIKNYLEMIIDRRELTVEELKIIIAEFSEYIDDSLVTEYFGQG